MKKDYGIGFDRTMERRAAKTQLTDPSPGTDMFDLLRRERKELDGGNAIDTYFHAEEVVEPDYLKEIGALAQQIGTLPADVRLSIIIPAYQEERNIEKTLEEIFKTEMEGPEKEIIVVINYSEGEAPDTTREKIEQLRQSHPATRLHIIQKVFPVSQASVGAARKLGSDIALLRYSQREQKDHSDKAFFIGGLDADTVDIPHDHYKKALMKMDSEQLDVLAGKPSSILPHLEAQGFFKKRQNLLTLVQLKRLITAEIDKRFNVIGQDFILSATAYARIGGIPRLRTGEDTAISERTIELGLSHGYFEGSNIRTSPRRSVADLEGSLFHDPHAPDRFTEVSKKIRQMESSGVDFDQLIEQIQDLTDEQLKRSIKRTILPFVKKISSSKNLYLDLALKEALEFLKTHIPSIDAQIFFELTSSEEEELYQDLLVDIYKNLAERTERQEEYFRRADSALQSAREKLSDPIVIAGADYKEYFETKAREALLRLRILEFVKRIPSDQFEARYEEIMQLERQRKLQELRMRTLGPKLAAISS